MRILWISDSPYSSSGYAGQTRQAVRRIKAMGHEVALLSGFGSQGGLAAWEGSPMYPLGRRHPYAQDVIPFYAADFGADIVVTLIDAWVYDGAALGRDVRWVPWAPIDHDPAPPPVIEAIRHSYQPIAYSQFGHEQMLAAGLDAWHIPHGIETGVFAPQDRMAARREMGIPEDAFLVGMVARNHGTPNRKLLCQNIEAFAMLQAAHPEARLYLHTEMGDEGVGDAENLSALVRRLGIYDHIHHANQHRLVNLGAAGFDDSWMARAYSAMDVLLTVSMGEGFGLPIVEAQACGTPVIHGAWCAGSELVGAGWRVDKKHATRYLTRQGSYQYMCGPDPIHGALEQAYQALKSPSIATQIRANARAFALRYDADTIAREHWAPALERIAQSIALPPRRIVRTIQPSEVLA